MVKKIFFPLLFLVLAYFVFSYENAKIIVAGVAIFLVGILFLATDLIATLGLKIRISHYAMPIIIFGIFFRFSKEQKNKGLCNILLGLGIWLMDFIIKR